MSFRLIIRTRRTSVSSNDLDFKFIIRGGDQEYRLAYDLPNDSLDLGISCIPTGVSGWRGRHEPAEIFGSGNIVSRPFVTSRSRLAKGDRWTCCSAVPWSYTVASSTHRGAPLTALYRRRKSCRQVWPRNSRSPLPPVVGAGAGDTPWPGKKGKSTGSGVTAPGWRVAKPCSTQTSASATAAPGTGRRARPSAARGGAGPPTSPPLCLPPSPTGPGCAV